MILPIKIFHPDHSGIEMLSLWDGNKEVSKVSISPKQSHPPKISPILSKDTQNREY